MSNALSIPSYHDIERAAARLETAAVETPLLESAALSNRVGGRVLIKAETLQHTGSFKFRGAYNRIAQLNSDERERGVVAYSSGNHAQAVALAARLFEVPAVILMPQDAPAIKIERTRGFGAEVVLFDRYRDNREAMGQALAAERGLTLVPPYDDPRIIAGAGTLGRELILQARARGISFDQFIVCCGGGGLSAGCTLAFEALSPDTALFIAEPEGFDDTTRSLAAGKRVANQPEARSLCDALLAPTPGELTFAVNQPRLSGGVAVSDSEVKAAMAFAARELKLVVEPGGAAALAAVLSGKLDCRNKTVAAVTTGGNVDLDLYAQCLR